MTDEKQQVAAPKVYDIVYMPGDGIGVPCAEEAKRVVEAAGLKVNWHHGDIGWEFWCKEGNALPERTIALLEKYRVGLFGAITSKPKKAADAELAPELRGKGYVYYSPIVTMRQKFDLDFCIRPCQSFLGNPLNFIKKDTTGKIIEPKIDVVIYRQNTECLYCGVEWTDPPPKVWDALKTHKKFETFGKMDKKDVAISARIFTRPYCTRIVEAAFEHAAKNGYKTVTVCEKPNVVRETSGMMLEIAQKIQKEKYPHIQLWDTNIDAQMMWLTKNPEDYGVIVCGNMFGDICSDGFAGLIGGLGFGYSGNIGRTCAVFEPTHGSAPKYADYKTQIINPIATILCAAMMCEHLGENAIGAKIRKSVAKVVAEGKVRTYDMLRLKGSEKVIQQGAASTRQMGDAIIAALENQSTMGILE